MVAFSRVIALAFLSSLLAGSVQAFTVDDRTDTKSDGSAKFSDPDDNVPVVHLSDDGTPSSSHSFIVPGGSQMSFGLKGSGSDSDSGPDAYQRAIERQQQ